MAAGNTLTARRRSRCAPIAAEGDARFAAIGRLIAEWQPDALVVGVPFHPDGAAHDNTRRARRFARQLHGRFSLPVHEVDERYTTTEALADCGVRTGGRRSRCRRSRGRDLLDQYLTRSHAVTTLHARRRSAVRRLLARRARAC